MRSRHLAILCMSIAIFLYLAIAMLVGPPAFADADNRVAHDSKLIGVWNLKRTLVSVAEGEEIHLEYVAAYSRWWFLKDGRLTLLSTRGTSVSKREFQWQTHRQQGKNVLKLSDANGPYLVGLYEFRDGNLWIAISLHPERVKSEPPSSFDCFKEPSLLVAVLERVEDKR